MKIRMRLEGSYELWVATVSFYILQIFIFLLTASTVLQMCVC